MKPIFPKQKQYVVFDWANLIHRAHHASKEDGFIDLLVRMLLKQRRQYPSTEFVFALEGEGAEVRRKMLPRYKAGRATDDEVGPRYSTSVELLKLLDCTIITAKYGEADDAIATFVEQNKQDSTITIVSEDRDLWQLISAKVRLMRSKGEVTEYTCRRELGVPPNHVACLKALIGDSSDNVPRAVPRMKSSILIQMALAGVTPADAYHKVREAGVVPEKCLADIVKHKSDIIRNFEVVKLQKRLDLTQEKYHADIPKVLDFLRRHQVKTIDGTAAGQLAGSIKGRP